MSVLFDAKLYYESLPYERKVANWSNKGSYHVNPNYRDRGDFRASTFMSSASTLLVVDRSQWNDSELSEDGPIVGSTVLFPDSKTRYIISKIECRRSGKNGTKGAILRWILHLREETPTCRTK